LHNTDKCKKKINILGVKKSQKMFNLAHPDVKKLILNTRKFHSKFKNVYKLNEKESIEWTFEWFLREKEGDNNYKITKEQIINYDKL